MVTNFKNMKNFILLIFISLLSNSLFAQEAKKIQTVENKTVKIQPSKTRYSNHDADQVNKDQESKIILTLSSKDNSSEKVNEEKLTPEQLEKIDERILVKENLIASIDKKVLDVKSNPEEDKKAQENGWYTQMETTKQEAIRDIEKLNALKNK